MDFKTATDRLTDGTTLTLSRVAEVFGITLNSLSRMRSGTSDTNRLRPPDGWEATVARLARQEAVHMTKRAAQLEELAGQLERR